MKSSAIYFFSILTSIIFFSEANASVTLEDSYFSTFKSYTCGYVDSTWVPGVKTGSSFETYKQIAERYRNTAKANRNKRRVKALYIKLAQRIDAKYRASYRGCKKLATPVSSARTTTLSKLPSIESIVAENPASSAVSTRAVTGTPPALVEIPGLGAKNVFWESGVIDAIRTSSASPTQCNQFFSSSVDGQSAGYGGCFMSQSVTETLGNAINSGNTLCYMKNAPTSANFAAGAIGIVEGSLPAGGISALFAPPTGSTSRIIGLLGTGPAEGSTINANQYSAFIRIYSSNELSSSGDLYKYDYWGCNGGSLEDIEQTRITTGGVYSSHNYNSHDGRSGELTLAARVTIGADGSISFDPTQDRTMSYTSSAPEGANKLFATISGSNTIVSKFFNSHAPDTQYGVSIANFSGSRFSNLRFLSGAFKDRFYRNSDLQFSNLSGMEYRSTNYASAPSMPEVALLSPIDLGSDSFFTSPSAVSLPSGFSCATTPDVGVSMNFENPALIAVRNTCEGDRRDNLNFCWSDTDLASAQSNYHTACP